jgi:hypothetical protein
MILFSGQCADRRSMSLLSSNGMSEWPTGASLHPRDKHVCSAGRFRISAALLVYWTPLVDGHAQTPDDVREASVENARFARCTSAFEEGYRLNVVRRR